MQEKQKIDKEIMSLLEVTEVSRFICRTNKGDLVLQLRKGEANYKLVLDAVPIPQELNETLMSLLFPVPIKEIVVPQVDKLIKIKK